jgi:orotate phosphoribosyltransferase
MTKHSLLDLPVHTGHFLLESGYHSNVWSNLDGLFVDFRKVAPLVSALAEKLQNYDVTAVCGPMVGGALLASAVARELGKRFYFTNRSAVSAAGLMSAEYVLPPEPSRAASHG